MKTLSDKRHDRLLSYIYEEEDVKEFIKALKDCPHADFIERGQFNIVYFQKWIDKLAGDKLI